MRREKTFLLTVLCVLLLCLGVASSNANEKSEGASNRSENADLLRGPSDVMLLAADNTQARVSPVRGNNGVGNGEDPPPPGWLNPRNPHFGQPENDGPGTGPGNPGKKD